MVPKTLALSVSFVRVQLHSEIILKFNTTVLLEPTEGYTNKFNFEGPIAT